MATSPFEVPDRFNAATFFVDRHIAEGRGGKVAFLHEEGELTYAGLQELVNRAGNALLGLGVEPEHRVLCLLLDSPAFLATFWGAIKIGAVPIPINTMMRGQDYLYFLNDSRARVAVISEPLLAEAGPILAQSRHLRHVVVVGKPGAGQIGFDPWLAKASSTLEAVDMSKDDVCFWLYSSGSTGFPKGAVHLQHDMVVCTDTYALQVLGITPEDRTFSAAKLFFAYGLGNNMYFPMRVGAQAVLYPHRPLPEAMFEVIHRHKPTIFFGVPTLYAAMLQVKEAEKRYDFSSVRRCVSAGEALPEEIYKRWRERFGVEILDGIGTTEILHIFLSNPPGRARPGSSGLAVPGYAARIVDDEGLPVAQGEIG
ncbi:MAG TPA: benzoate-CoA ligase family protein, partial [Methylomirabilota bacterium]|nr:benzoate-CoA ligase family protein [Methylomirabilota bacterium]